MFLERTQWGLQWSVMSLFAGTKVNEGERGIWDLTKYEYVHDFGIVTHMGSIWKAGGLFGNMAINCAEFTPLDTYELEIFEAPYVPSRNCALADPDNVEFCQVQTQDSTLKEEEKNCDTYMRENGPILLIITTGRFSGNCEYHFLGSTRLPHFLTCGNIAQAKVQIMTID